MGAATADCPKPMLTVGDGPVLWHLIRYYASFGHRDFLIAAGYRGECIHRFFASLAGNGSPSPSSTNGSTAASTWHCDGLQIRVVNTGTDTDTGGRVRRLAPWLADAPFMLTWGDGLADVNLTALRNFHESHGRLMTVTAVHPPERFGRLTLDDCTVVGFEEKPPQSRDWINGAYFVVDPAVLSTIDGDSTSWERVVMPRLVADGQLRAWKHPSFWRCMDTPRERQQLEELWQSGRAPWKRWT